MCGLCGFATKLEVNDKLTNEQKDKKARALKGLMLAMEDRGNDSTGLAFIKDNDLEIIKKAKKAQEFIKSSQIDKAFLENPNIVIGHTRAATAGEVNDENAHPFLKGSIVGAHNGIVSNCLEIDKKVNVDSEIIFQLLNKSNNNFEKTFKRLSGSFAITWANLKEPNKVFLVRNELPLSVVYVPEIKTYFWASTEYALRSVVGILFKSTKEVWEPSLNCVYAFDEQLRVIKHKVKFKENYSFNQYEYGNYYGNYGYEHQKQLIRNHREIDDYDPAFESIVEAAECEFCGGILDTKEGFWWNCDEFFPLCRKCFNERKENGTWELIEEENYKEMKQIVQYVREHPKELENEFSFD